jgi:hypothetical protein
LAVRATILALLTERLGLADSATPIEYDDLDELAGTGCRSRSGEPRRPDQAAPFSPDGLQPRAGATR